jgi:hypothetical protein
MPDGGVGAKNVNWRARHGSAREHLVAEFDPRDTEAISQKKPKWRGPDESFRQNMQEEAA